MQILPTIVLTWLGSAEALVFHYFKGSSAHLSPRDRTSAPVQHQLWHFSLQCLRFSFGKEFPHGRNSWFPWNCLISKCLPLGLWWRSWQAAEVASCCCCSASATALLSINVSFLKRGQWFRKKFCPWMSEECWPAPLFYPRLVVGFPPAADL